MFYYDILEDAKGQLVSKCLFGAFNSSKNRTKNFSLSRLGHGGQTSMARVEIEIFRFVWKNLEHQIVISKLTDL